MWNAVKFIKNDVDESIKIMTIVKETKMKKKDWSAQSLIQISDLNLLLCLTQFSISELISRNTAFF